MIRPKLLVFFIMGLACAAALCPAIGESFTHSEPVYFYASQPGEKTLDQGVGGGNPFASSLVEILKYDNLSFNQFVNKLQYLTLKKSRGYQKVDLSLNASRETGELVLASTGEKPVALVVVYSDYSGSGYDSLPGAEKDFHRVSIALAGAGFEVFNSKDPSRDELNTILSKFSDRSKTSDMALIYTTGHGVEVDGVVYLLPSDEMAFKNSAHLRGKAVLVSDMAGYLRGIKRNLIFYGGCRDNPIGSKKTVTR